MSLFVNTDVTFSMYCLMLFSFIVYLFIVHSGLLILADDETVHSVYLRPIYMGKQDDSVLSST